MRRRIGMRALAWLGVLLMLVFSAASVDARGGRGGGGRGGGGRSISRSGPAAGGSFRTSPSYSRPSSYPSGSRSGSYSGQRPSTLPSGGQRPATQPARPGQQQPVRAATQPGQRPGERPGERPGGGENRPDREANREDWQQHLDEAREDRQDYAKKAREDWQEYADWDEYNHYWVGGWHGVVVHDDDDVEWGTFLAGIVIGTALSSAAYNSMRTETGCSPTEVDVNGITYMKCGNTWYNRVMQGGSVNYVVVAAPPGF